MVLNNNTPYSSDDDENPDTWQFVNDEIPDDLVLAAAKKEESSANQNDAPSRTPLVDENCNATRENEMHASVKDGGKEMNAEENLDAGVPVETDEPSDSMDKNSTPSDCNETKEQPNITADAENANDENADPWIPLHAEDATPNNRPESPDQHLPLPLHQTWNFITSSLREIDNQNQIRQRAQSRVNNMNTSAQNLWSNLTTSTQRIATNLQTHCDQADEKAREASLNLRRSLSKTKDNLCRLNSEYKIHEKVAAVAAVGGAILVALGNPRAGAGAVLVAGGVGSERGCSTFNLS
jgi:hypothetical protein